MDQVPEMLHALLEQRFKLSIHRGTKNFPVYALTVGKDGPNLVPRAIWCHVRSPCRCW